MVHYRLRENFRQVSLVITVATPFSGAEISDRNNQNY